LGSKVSVGVEASTQGRAARTHREDHGNHLVDGQVGVIEPAIEDAPGGEGGHGQRDAFRELGAKRTKQAPVEGTLGPGGVEVHLQAAYAGHANALDHEVQNLVLLAVVEGGSHIGLDANDRGQLGVFGDSQGLPSRDLDDTRVSDAQRAGEKGHTDVVSLKEAQVFGTLPSPEDDGGCWRRGFAAREQEGEREKEPSERGMHGDSLRFATREYSSSAGPSASAGTNY
jgi:hypothetical protein